MDLGYGLLHFEARQHAFIKPEIHTSFRFRNSDDRNLKLRPKLRGPS
jgi:hypothetical protein